MSDYGTRLAMWSLQGRRTCRDCGAKVYESYVYGLQHVDTDIKGQAHLPRSEKP